MASSVDVGIAAGITYRQVDYWVRRSVLHSEEDSPGSGQLRSFTNHEVAVARVLGALRPFCSNLDMLTDVASFLRERPRELWPPVLFATLNGVVTRHPESPAAIRIDVGSIMAERALAS